MGEGVLLKSSKQAGKEPLESAGFFGLCPGIMSLPQNSQNLQWLSEPISLACLLIPWILGQKQKTQHRQEARSKRSHEKDKN